MPFILSKQRSVDVVAAFASYREYVTANAGRFPPGAHGLATSDWYLDATNHRCPHDAWLESVTIDEPAEAPRGSVRRTTLTIRLLGAYHDGHIELRYADVAQYVLTNIAAESGHGDWLYDELRVDDLGRLEHEIEWSRGDGRWLITAGDVAYRWVGR
jgi:hypothetical protein